MVMRIYGSELRQAALAALEKGQTRRVVSLLFGVSIPTLDRWKRQQHQSGQIAPRPRGHLRSAFGPSGSTERQVLEALLKESPDATLQQLLEEWQKRTGQSASRASLARAITHLGWTRKKRA